MQWGTQRGQRGGEQGRVGHTHRVRGTQRGGGDRGRVGHTHRVRGTQRGGGGSREG